MSHAAAGRHAWIKPAVEDLGGGIYRIPLPLPLDGLKAVNVYAITDPGGVDLIDAGMAMVAARERLMLWADAKRRLKVRANAETPLDCRTAREFGAEGIGLCRTEHMFFDAERIMNVRRMILAEDEAGRRAALDLTPHPPCAVAAHY